MKGRKENGGMLTRREFLSLTGTGVAGLALAGGTGAALGAEKRPKHGGRLRVGQRWGSIGLDAHKNQDMPDYLNYCLMYGALTETGKPPQVEIYPMLAKSWEISKDGREYVFSLREGVKFHHGKELDSGDVKYSIERVMSPVTRAPRAFAFRWIESVQAIDRYNIKIKLIEPFAPFLTTMTLNNCPIIPSGSEPTGTKPAPGTGPFVLKSFVPNESTEYTRFNQYWEVDEQTGDRLPYLDGLHTKKIVDEVVRMTALRAGDLDFVDTPPLNMVAGAVLEKPIPGIQMEYDILGNNLIFFNVSKPPFDSRKVRQAVAYALDKKKILQAVFWGLGETTDHQPFLKQSRFYVPVKERESDVARARQLLAEAGYPNGFKTEFFEYSMTQQLAGTEAAIGQLKEIGIQATMKVIDRAPYYSMMKKGEYDISLFASDERYDPDDAYYMFYHSGEIDKNNWSRYSNKELDALLEKGRTTEKWPDRAPIYKRIVEILSEDVPMLYLYKSVIGCAHRDYLKGYRKGFALRYAWHGGGAKYWWMDK